MPTLSASGATPVRHLCWGRSSKCPKIGCFVLIHVFKQQQQNWLPTQIPKKPLSNRSIALYFSSIVKQLDEASMVRVCFHIHSSKKLDMQVKAMKCGWGRNCKTAYHHDLQVQQFELKTLCAYIYYRLIWLQITLCPGKCLPRRGCRHKS